MSIPKLVAHRGYALHYPENTLIGIEAAINAGAEFFEIDVQLTADRVPVLFHDRTLQRVCGVSGPMHQIDSSGLATLSAAEAGRFGDRFKHERVPTLAACCELLGRHPGVTAFIEVKAEPIEHFGLEPVFDRVTQALDPVARQCVLISFSMELLALAHARGCHPLAAVIERWRDLDKVGRVRPEYLFCDVKGLPRSGDLTLEWTRLVVYEVVDPIEALALARRGVAFIETFAFGELRAGLKAALCQPG